MKSEANATKKHHSVVRLRVVGGFLGGLELEFTDGLNCVIGGRGTGKTTALEFMRFGLGLMPDPRISPQRARAVEALVKANLGGGRISVELQTKTGMRYTAERGAAEAIQVINEAGTAVPVVLDRDQIFGADVFSQNEIEEIATNPAAQLSLIDRFGETSKSGEIARDLELLRRQVDQTSVELSRLDNEIEDLAAKASELPVLEEKLKGVAQAGGPDAERINAAHTAKGQREREIQIPGQVVVATQRVTSEVAAAVSTFRTNAEAQFASVRGGVNAAVIDQLDEDVREFERVLVAAVGMIGTAARAAEAVIEQRKSTLAEKHAVQEAEYRALVSKSEEEGGRALERATLRKNQTEAITASKQRDAKEAHRSVVASRRAELLAKMSELRDSRFTARKAVADRLTNQLSNVRVTISQAADAKRYRDVIVKALKGLPLKPGPTADRLTEAFLPAELAQAALSRNVSMIAERTTYDDDRARKIVDALRSDGIAYELEVIDLDDVPCIELLDGANYKESQHLSTGQRCTTILPILLAQSERPLLVDQPEDNLDNAFIYDTIVKALRAVRETRQVIFVTHNPNIPVLGEAERIFVLQSDGQKASVRRVGSVDECKDDVETLLEGGREAFLQRKKRYGH